MSTQVNLDKLQDWAESIGAEIAIHFDRRCPADGGTWHWHLRVRYYWHKQQSIRTLSGEDIEVVAADLLPLAMGEYEKRKDFWQKGRKDAEKKHRNAVRRDFAEIERNHMGAGDF